MDNNVALANDDLVTYQIQNKDTQQPPINPDPTPAQPEGQPKPSAANDISFSSSEEQRDPNGDDNQSLTDQQGDRLKKRQSKTSRRKKQRGDSDQDKSNSRSPRNRDRDNSLRGSPDSERNKDFGRGGHGLDQGGENAEEMIDRDQRRKYRDRERRDDMRSPGRNDRGQDDRFDDYGEGGNHRRDRDRGRKERGHRNKIEFPSFLKPMFTRKEFEYFQQQKFDRQSVYEAYNDYSVEYKHFQEQNFYKNHRNDPWFIEKYDPCEIYKQKQNLKKVSQYQAMMFRDLVLSDLESEKSQYRKIKLEQDPTVDYNLLHDQDGKEVNLQKAPLFSFDTDYLTLYLKYIPKHIKRLELTTNLQKNLNGFVHLSMSEPMRNAGFERLAWATFSNENDCQQAEHQINDIKMDDFNLQAVRSLPNRKRPPVRITPPLPKSMIEVDLELCKFLITDVFDPEKEIETFLVKSLEKYTAPTGDNQPGNEQKVEETPNDEAKEGEQIIEKNELEMQKSKSHSMPLTQQNQEGSDLKYLTNEQQLDLMLIYLRRVHGYDMYCGEEYEDERMLSTKCGPQHLRNSQKINETDFQEIFTKSSKEVGNAEEQAEDESQEIEIGQDFQMNETLFKINSMIEADQKKKAQMQFFNKIAQLNPVQSAQSANYGGSITFLTKYTKAALDRIEAGPRCLMNPEEEFYQNDLDLYCRSLAKELDNNVGWGCKLCDKKFKSIEFVVTHIKNKHTDKIDETYKNPSTKEWFEKTFQKEMKKSMKNNYYTDPNKLMNQAGRKYYPYETSYYTGNQDWRADGQAGARGGEPTMGRNSKSSRGNFGGGGRGRQDGGFRGGYKNHKEYVDYDDPSENAKNRRKKDDDRDLVDYSDLFG